MNDEITTLILQALRKLDNSMIGLGYQQTKWVIFCSPDLAQSVTQMILDRHWLPPQISVAVDDSIAKFGPIIIFPNPFRSDLLMMHINVKKQISTMMGAGRFLDLIHEHINQEMWKMWRKND